MSLIPKRVTMDVIWGVSDRIDGFCFEVRGLGLGFRVWGLDVSLIHESRNPSATMLEMTMKGFASATKLEVTVKGFVKTSMPWHFPECGTCTMLHKEPRT